MTEGFSGALDDFLFIGLQTFCLKVTTQLSLECHTYLSSYV